MSVKSPSAWHCAHSGGLVLFRGSWVKTCIVTVDFVSPLIILFVRGPGLCLSSTFGSLVKGYWECWVRIISEVEYCQDYKRNKRKKVFFFFFFWILISVRSQARVGKINKRQMQEPGRLWEVKNPKLVLSWKTWGGLVQREQKGPWCLCPLTYNNRYVCFSPKGESWGEKNIVTFILHVLVILFLSVITREKEGQDVGLYGG